MLANRLDADTDIRPDMKRRYLMSVELARKGIQESMGATWPSVYPRWRPSRPSQPNQSSPRQTTNPRAEALRNHTAPEPVSSLPTHVYFAAFVSDSEPEAEAPPPDTDSDSEDSTVPSLPDLVERNPSHYDSDSEDESSLQPSDLSDDEMSLSSASADSSDSSQDSDAQPLVAQPRPNPREIVYVDIGSEDSDWSEDSDSSVAPSSHESNASEPASSHTAPTECDLDSDSSVDSEPPPGTFGYRRDLDSDSSVDSEPPPGTFGYRRCNDPDCSDCAIAHSDDWFSTTEEELSHFEPAQPLPPYPGLRHPGNPHLNPGIQHPVDPLALAYTAPTDSKPAEVSQPSEAMPAFIAPLKARTAINPSHTFEVIWDTGASMSITFDPDLGHWSLHVNHP